MDIMLSVVIPLYIGEDETLVTRVGLPVWYMHKCVEYIYVVDENDTVPEELEGLCKKNPDRVRVERLTGGSGYFSLARARNVGVARSRGSIILFSDVDLFPHRKFYDNLIRFIKKRGVGEAENIFYPIPAVYLRPLHMNKAMAELGRVDMNDELLFGKPSVSVDRICRVSSSILISRSFYMRLGGQYEGFEGWGFEDWHFLWKLMMFPQPVPEPSGHQSADWRATNGYKTWRDAAELLGEEAFRANLFLYHAHHPERTSGWKTRRDDNQRLYNRLTSTNKLEINFSPSVGITKDRAVVDIYSDCPSVANRLFYEAGTLLKLHSVKALTRMNPRHIKREGGHPLVLGGLMLTEDDLSGASYLMKAGVPFQLVYPTALSTRNIMLHFDGTRFTPLAENDSDCDSGIDERALLMECGGLEYFAAADAFRQERGLEGKKVVLVHFSRQSIDSEVEPAFGIPDVELRSLIYGLAPLFDQDTVFVVYDSLSNHRDTPFNNMLYASDRDLEMLYLVSDLVIAQSPEDVGRALIRRKPVVTTGDLMSLIFESVPVVTSVTGLYEWIRQTEREVPHVWHNDVKRLFAVTSRFILTGSSSQMPEYPGNNPHAYRVLYEEVNHVLHRAAYRFRWNTWERRHYSLVNPVVSDGGALRLHREVDHDYRVLDRAKSGAVKPKPAQAASVTPLRAPGPKSTGTGEVSEVLRDVHVRGSERHGLIKGGGGTFKRKMRKLRRDPYRYFDDAKNPLIRNLKYVFAR